MVFMDKPTPEQIQEAIAAADSLRWWLKHTIESLCKSLEDEAAGLMERAAEMREWRP